MIGRLLRMLVGTMLYFCAATVVAESVVAAYLVVSLHIDRRRLAQMVAVARGVDLSIVKESRPKEPESPAEQASYEQILEARAIKTRNLEIREQALKSALDQLRGEQGRLAEDKDSFQKLKSAFEENLAAIKKQTLDAGWDQNRNTLLSLKPKQAKELILQMLQKDEHEEVVALMGPMPETRLAKIIGEFKTPEETKQIDEVLRRIRHGEPINDATEKVQQQLGAAAKEQGTQ
jgi:hypothetical protein